MLMRFPILACAIATSLMTACGPLAGDSDGGNSTPTPALAANGWPIDCLPDDYEGSGTAVGDTILSMPGQHDQHGNTDVYFGQFYGSMLLISFGAMWCAPCHEAASTSQQLMEDLNDELGGEVSFWEIEFLADDGNAGTSPDGGWAELDDAEDWAGDYGIEYPVLHGRPAWRQNELWGISSLPTLFIVDPKFEVREVIEGFPGDAAITNSVTAAWESFRTENPDWSPPCEGR